LAQARQRIAEIAEKRRFHAFISFGGPVDRIVARRLRRALRSVTARWPWQHPVHVFLDEGSLAADSELLAGLRRGLDDSERMILLASEDSAASWGVRHELEHWLATRTERVLLVHTGGTLSWPPDAGDFAWADDATTALSERHFRGVFRDQPAWVDLTGVRAGRFRGQRLIRMAAAKLVAAITDVEPQELWRFERRRHRLRLAGLGVLAVVAATAIAFAVRYAGQAAAKDLENRVQALLASAEERAGRLDTALLLTGAAYRLSPDSVARHRLFAQAAAYPGLRAIPLAPPAGLGGVEQVSFSADGGLLAGAVALPNGPSTRAGLLLWPGTGVGAPVELPVPGLGGTRASSVAFWPGGRRIAVGSTAGAVAVLSLGETWPPTATDVIALPGKGHVADRVSFDAGGRRLAVSYDDGTTTVWDLDNQRPVRSFPGRASTYGGGRLASLVPERGAVVLRDAGTLEPSDPIATNLIEPTDLAFRPDGRRIAVAGGAIRFSATGPGMAIVDVAARAVRPVENSNGENAIAYGGNDDVVTSSSVIESVTSANPLITARVPRMVTRSIAIDPASGNIAYAGAWPDGGSGAILLFEPRTTPQKSTGTRVSTQKASALSPDGRVLAVTGANGRVSLVDSMTGRPLPVQPEGGAMAPTSLVFSRDGTRLAGAGGRLVTIWTLPDGVAHTVSRPPSGDDAGTGLAFSPDGETLAAAVPGGVLLVPVADPASPARRTLATGPACDVSFSPEGRRLAVATKEGAQLWELGPDRRTGLIPPPATDSQPSHCAGTVAARFAVNGTVLVSASGSTIAVSHLDGGRTEALPEPVRNQAGITAGDPGWNRYAHLGVSPDGMLVAAAGEVGSVVLWDLTTMRQVGPMLLSDGQISAVSLGGSTLVAAGTTVTTWNLDPEYWFGWMCQAVQRDLTDTEWHRFGAGPRPEECT
jgi:WD40 repeat protein